MDRPMDDDLRAGIAIYNAGRYHAAHDAWEDRWLGLEPGTDDERLLHGLIQFTAVVHHAQAANWTGVRGLAESGADYLAALPPSYRSVNVEAVRTYLEAVAGDPVHLERVTPPSLEYDDRAIQLTDLDHPAIAVAARVLAESHEGYDESIVDRAIAFADEVVTARASGSTVGDDRFVALLADFVQDPAHRDLIYRRLAAHVERLVAEREDVEGLFD
jgi:limonene-1,2-epoxide hydrolase